MKEGSKASSRTLYYIRDAKKERQIAELCRDLGMSPVMLKEGDADRSLGILAGLFPPELEPKKEKKAPLGWRMPELLVFCQLADGQLDDFLAEYRRRNIEPTGLKAVATPHNLFWTVYELAEELEQERAAMLAMRRNGKENEG